MKSGRLQIIEKDAAKKRSYYICKCDCGKTVSVRADSLFKKSFSCGCKQKEVVANYCRKNFSKQNKIEETNGVLYIYLQDGSVCKTESCFYEKIKNHYWMKNSLGYVVSSNRDFCLFHRFIFDADDIDGLVVDHINHDLLDNRTTNLRVCRQDQNVFNRAIFSKNSSGITGVYWNKQKGSWNAKIGCKRKKYDLGYFKRKEDAILARKNAELSLFGQFSAYALSKAQEVQEN